MKHFAIVVPALNEEGAIAGTLRRAQAARQKVMAATPVREMTIVFVNDGCTDRTQEIVDQAEFAEVRKVNYGRNRGYGAAIKAGWQAAPEADVVGFIDADGTCDPDFCVNLLQRMQETDADVVLAGRLNPNSEMPLIRKVGNRIFATLLGVVSGHTDITDTASGFRVVRRDSLKLMSPLPDGLHFTPAMSCICLLDPRLKIEEVPMPYKERIGRSKLSVIKDGLRFLYTILFSACCYSPLKTMAGASVLGAVAMAALITLLLTIFNGMSALGVGLGLLSALMIIQALATGVIVHQLNWLLIGPRRQVGPIERALQYLLQYKRLFGLGMTMMAVGTLGAVASYTLLDPSRALNAALSLALVLLAMLGGTAILGGVIVRVIWAVGEKQKALITDEYRVKVEPKASAGAGPAAVGGKRAEPEAPGALQLGNRLTNLGNG